MTDIDQKRIFSKNLNYFLSQNNKTQKEVADAISVSPQTFNTWCQGIALPRMGKVQKLADYFHIEKSDLIDEQKEEIPHPCKELTDIYVQLSDNNQGKVLQYSKNLLSSQQMEKEAELLAAHARTTIESTEDGLKRDLDIMNNDDMWK